MEKENLDRVIAVLETRLENIKETLLEIKEDLKELNNIPEKVKELERRIKELEETKDFIYKEITKKLIFFLFSLIGAYALIKEIINNFLTSH